MKKSVILFLIFGAIFYSVSATVFAADDSDDLIAQAGSKLELKKAVTVDKSAPILNVPEEKTDGDEKSMMAEMQEKKAKLQEKNSKEESSSNEGSAAGKDSLGAEALAAADGQDVETAAPEGLADLSADSEQEAGDESQGEAKKSETGNNPPAPPPPVTPPALPGTEGDISDTADGQGAEPEKLEGTEEAAPVETADAPVPIEGPIVSEPTEATASDLYLDALTQPAAQEAQNEAALNEVFSETPSNSQQGGNEAQAEGGESEGNAAAGAGDQAVTSQTNMAKKAAAISQTIGEFSTLSARPAGTANQASANIHASEQQNFVAAMNVMGSDRQFFSQVMGVTPGENAPVQMEQMVANMQTGFAQMAEKMAVFFAPGQGGPQPGEQGIPGTPGPNAPAGPMMGGPMPFGVVPGPNGGPVGAGGMPVGPMPMGMFSMNQMANVMGTAMMAVAMGAPPDKVMGTVEGTMQAMHAHAEAYFAANSEFNANNQEGMTGPMPPGAMPMPGGMEGGSFMPGPQFGAGSGPNVDSDFNFGAMTQGPVFGETNREFAQAIASNITQQLIAQQVIQKNLPPEALNTLQALNDNFAAADLTFLQNNPGQDIMRAFNAEITTQFKNTSNVSVAFPGEEHVHVTYSHNTAPGPGDIPFTHVDAEVTAIHSSDHSETALLPAEAAHIPGVS